jgi:hypothetical protein
MLEMPDNKRALARSADVLWHDSKPGSPHEVG